MFKAIIVSSLITVSSYSYSFASSDVIDGTIDEVAVLLDCFQKNIGDIYDDKKNFSINCDKWYGNATNPRQNINCSQSLLEEWFGSWLSTKTSLEKLTIPMPVCFKTGDRNIGYISKKILNLDKNIIDNSKYIFSLRSYNCEEKENCENNNDLYNGRLNKINSELNMDKTRDNVEIENRDNYKEITVDFSNSKKVFFVPKKMKRRD